MKGKTHGLANTENSIISPYYETSKQSPKKNEYGIVASSSRKENDIEPKIGESLQVENSNRRTCSDTNTNLSFKRKTNVLQAKHVESESEIDDLSHSSDSDEEFMFGKSRSKQKVKRYEP